MVHCSRFIRRRTKEIDRTNSYKRTYEVDASTTYEPTGSNLNTGLLVEIRTNYTLTVLMVVI